MDRAGNRIPPSPSISGFHAGFPETLDLVASPAASQVNSASWLPFRMDVDVLIKERLFGSFFPWWSNSCEDMKIAPILVKNFTFIVDQITSSQSWSMVIKLPTTDLCYSMNNVHIRTSVLFIIIIIQKSRSPSSQSFSTSQSPSSPPSCSSLPISPARELRRGTWQRGSLSACRRSRRGRISWKIFCAWSPFDVN